MNTIDSNLNERSNNKVKVLLVNPPLPHNKRLKRVYPMGLLYIASYLKKHSKNSEVTIFNPQVTNTGFKDTLNRVLSTQWDVLGIGYWTNQFLFAKKLTEAIRSSGKKGIIVHGGVHPTVRPEDVASSCDIVMLHEAEISFYELISKLSDGYDITDINGIAYLRDNTLQVNTPSGFIKDLDTLPFPDYSLLDLKYYTTPLHVIGGKRVPLIGSRGCPYNCSYCVSPKLWQRKVRWRSPENIADEMEYVIKTTGINQFHFWDDNLFLNKKHLINLAEEILKRGLQVKWLGLTRASHIVAHEDIVPLLARAGMIGMEIGIESANPVAYSIVDKNETLDNLIRACEIQKQNGMFPLYTYMSYLPGDTIRGAYNQAQFMDSLLKGLPRYKYFHHLPFDLYIGQCCTPHVGTKMFEEAESLGMPLWRDEEDFHHSATCFLPHSLLEDIPVKIDCKLTVDDRVFCVIVSYVAIADYLRYDSPYLKVLNVSALNHLLDRFWEAIDGDNSIIEIVKMIHQVDSQGLDFRDMLKFCAAFSITLGQCGVIDSLSSSQGSDLKIQRKYIPYNKSLLYKTALQTARFIGKALGLKDFVFKRHLSYET